MTTPSSPAIGSDRAALAERRPVAGSTASRVRRAILWGGSIAGVLDISYVLIIFPLWRGSSPIRILQGIAGGVLGPANAVNGGLATAAIGLLCHFVIATGAATTYALAATRLPLLTRRPILSGSIFGVCVYIVMNFVVVPLSRIGGRGPSLSWPAAVVFLAHIICVGIPIALCTKRAWTTSNER